MRSFWSDPYLWIHLAGIAALPLFLELCLVGLATGDPVLPFGIELFLVAVIGIAPVFWMQWQRPFYIYSLVALSLKPEQLTEQQRRLLTLFKVQQNNRLPVILATVFLVAVLRQIYILAPIAAPVDPLPDDWRLVGLLLAGIAFFGCNLFLQVPLSVLRVMLTSEAQVAATEPYPLETIAQDLTIVGLKVNQIVPPLQADEMPIAAVASTPIPSVTKPVPEAVAEPIAEPVAEPVVEMPPAETPVTEIVDSTSAPTSEEGAVPKPPEEEDWSID